MSVAPPLVCVRSNMERDTINYVIRLLHKRKLHRYIHLPYVDAGKLLALRQCRLLNFSNCRVERQCVDEYRYFGKTPYTQVKRVVDFIESLRRYNSRRR